MQEELTDNLLSRINELELRLSEAHQLIDAIKDGEVDAFAFNRNNVAEVYTLQTGDYVYRMLIEKFGEGAINLTEDGLIVYCNSYFSSLLDVPYEKVIGSFIFDWIEKGYLAGFRELFSNALSGGSKGEIVFSTGSRSIPVYCSLTSLQPNLPTVGMIVTDLTEKKRQEELIDNYAMQLSVKNRDLENQNVELASFSYVASHDLQEPLRKIQTFASRIIEKERLTLSDQGTDYFNRIQNAAARMQKLIEALLSYSRTNSSNLILRPTDLNVVVEEVKRNLADDIQEKGVIIESADLPVLNLVHLQFHQLLVNLISNAIKYNRPGIPPHITITADQVTRSADWPDNKFSSDKYWKISIEDNGIGFKQEYADRIFELFQRLHGRTEYEGTGIGLAICKKIAQNHRGFISAKGIPGEGSIFSIFLPVKDGSSPA